MSWTAGSCVGVKSSEPPVILLAGPTACGKSDLVMGLAQRFPIEIISVDAAQVYRGLDIGTAKPSEQDRKKVPHHLIDIREPEQTYSASDFVADAIQAIRSITARGCIPVLAGGTMFYFSAFQGGLSSLPGANEQVRIEISEEAGAIGWPAMHEKLARVDPDAAIRIDRADAQRIQRALEVYRISGQSLTSLNQRNVRQAYAGMTVRIALFDTSRQALHRRIQQRFQHMIECGFENEVRKLSPRLDDATLPAARAVGYRQMLACIRGETSMEQAVNQAVAATRQLAKRQLTWLRGESGWVWTDNGSGRALDSLTKYLDVLTQEKRLSFQGLQAI